MNIPIVKLELEHMRHSMMNAFMSHSDEMQVLVQEAVDAYCTEEALIKEVRKHATNAVNQSIKEELDKFFLYGEGKEVIRKVLSEAFTKAF